MSTIITIARQFGSGGRELGRRLAEELNIEYYDKEIITEIAKHTSLSEDYVRNVTRSRMHSLYPITVGQSISYMSDYGYKQIQNVYNAQNAIINELADKSDCVIIGRCADYILRDKNPHRLFVYATPEYRVERCFKRASEDENFTEKQMLKHIKSIDKNRAKYYNFYTGREWGNVSNYDLCINTTDLVIKDFVPVIAKLFK